MSPVQASTTPGLAGRPPTRTLHSGHPPAEPRLEHLHAIDLRLLGGALLILAGIASSLLARRFGAPLLLVFLLLGLLLGEDGLFGIQ